MFAMIIGKCVIVPNSPKIALLLVMWLYGTVPGWSYDNYREQFLANGGTEQSVAVVEECFESWATMKNREAVEPNIDSQSDQEQSEK